MKKGQGGYAVRQKQELKFVFHNPNTPEATEEFLSKWIARICLPQVERLVSEKMDADNATTQNGLGYVGKEDIYKARENAISKQHNMADESEKIHRQQ